MDINLLQVIATITPILVVIGVQTLTWVYKFGKLEQKVYDQNGRIARVEKRLDIKDQQILKDRDQMEDDRSRISKLEQKTK